MKIAQVTLRFDAPGGVETNVREVAGRLARMGESVRVYASDLYDEAAWVRRSGYPTVVDGVPVRRFPVFKRLLPGLTMPLMPGLVRDLEADRPDVIHAHSHRYGHVLEAAAVAQSRSIPLVVSTHYHPADRGEPAWKRGLLRVQDVAFGMTAYRVARALIVETELEARLVAEFAPSTTIRVIPPGIDLEAWTSEPARAPSSGLTEGYLLYAGRIASNKGLEFLLEAVARLPPSERPPLVLMGRDWGERGRLEADARRLGLGLSVRFLGHVADPAEYRAVVRGARLFVLPSEWEAFGLVLLEAMAAKVPIVATAVGGVPEVLDGGRAGRLVPYGDAEALASAIRDLVSDPARRAQLTDAGARRVSGLTWDRAAERHRALYRELVDGVRSSSQISSASDRDADRSGSR